jgi:hypothetical protein
MTYILVELLLIYDIVITFFEAVVMILIKRLIRLNIQQKTIVN